MALSAEMEDYLEAIAALSASNGEARVTDIAKRLSVRKPSVTQALQSLTDKGFLHYKPYASPVLTASGRRAAAAVQRRHDVMKSFLVDVLQVDWAAAEANACRLEHAVDKEVLEHLTRFMDFVQRCPRGGTDWVRDGYEHFCDPEQQHAKCERCMQTALDEFRAATTSGAQTESDQNQTTENSTMNLAEVPSGETVRIVRVGKAGAVRKRIVDMGVVRGTPAKVVKVAPFGDPIEIKVKGYSLTLRKAEAAAIEVEKADDSG